MKDLGAGEQSWEELVNDSRLERIPEVPGKLVVNGDAKPEHSEVESVESIPTPKQPVGLVGSLLDPPQVLHVVDPDQDDGRLRLRSSVDHVQELCCDSKA